MNEFNRKINGETIYLRKLINKDATKKYCSWLNDPGVNKFLETRKSTIKDLKEYIKKQNHNQDSLFLGVFDKKNNVHIGNIKLEPIDWKKKKAIFGIIIGDKNYWGRGVGQEATKLTISYAFKNLGLKEIELGVISQNERARKAFERSGFKVTGLEKKAMNHDGILYDKVIMKIINNNCN
ncbi:MAG: GNAT family protein [Patescibacteria group bacterium]